MLPTTKKHAHGIDEGNEQNGNHNSEETTDANQPNRAV